MTETQIFEPDGRAIPYVDDRGNGPALALIPDHGLDIGYLGPLAHALAAEEFHIVRIGPRRASAGEDADVSVHDRAQDVVDVLDHLGIARTWVGGHGSGGSVARTVSLEHRDRVNGVLLLGVETTESPAELAPGIPVLVVQGTEDQAAPPENGEALQASAPDRVSVVRVEGGGQLFPATHVGATSWAIEDYLDWD